MTTGDVSHQMESVMEDKERARKMFDAFKQVLSLEAQKIYQCYFQWFDPMLVQINVRGNRAVLSSKIDNGPIILQLPLVLGRIIIPSRE